MREESDIAFKVSNNIVFEKNIINLFQSSALFVHAPRVMQ